MVHRDDAIHAPPEEGLRSDANARAVSGRGASPRAARLRAEQVESVLASMSLFQHLRPDELGRVAARFEVRGLAVGERLEPGDGAARLLVVIDGRVDLTLSEGRHHATTTLDAGDHHGLVHVVAGLGEAVAVAAVRPTHLALLDPTAFADLVREFPAIALPAASELASRVRAQTDLLREVSALEDEPAALRRLRLHECNRANLRGRVDVARMSPAAIFRRLVVQEGAEPPFWMLGGFLFAVVGVRAAVIVVFKLHLEHEIFWLRPSGGPNPMHIHHFNYGLVVMSATGLAALSPLGRRAVRVLGALFGIGAGLILEEFSVIWNLNPDPRSNSLTAAAVALVALVQLTYFRRFWATLARRALRAAQRARTDEDAA
jgi:CRP-like cAMP-binding protein